MCALIQSRLDYANTLYAGMSSTNFDKVQRVQNTVARDVTPPVKIDHITPALERLHWLPILYRVDYKLSRLTYKIHLSGKPPHLRSQMVDYNPVTDLLTNIYMLSQGLSLRLHRVHSVLRPLNYGTRCRLKSATQRH